MAVILIGSVSSGTPGVERRLSGPDDNRPGGAGSTQRSGPGGCRAGWGRVLPNADVEGEKLSKQAVSASDPDKVREPVRT